MTPINTKRQYLSQCRRSRGTQEQIAKELGISTVYLRLIENGTFKPGRDLLFRMVDYFGEPIEKLFPDVVR